MIARNNPETEIAFLEHNPYMSVELLDILQDYRILCYNNDKTYQYLQKHWSVSSYMNEQFLEELDSDKVAELLLKDNSFLQRSLTAKNTWILFFYMNSEMNRLTKKARLNLLLPEFSLQESFGDKTLLSSICGKLQLPTNATLSFRLPIEAVNIYDECSRTLGLPFIVQAGQGESGWDTALVGSLEQFVQALKRVGSTLRVSKYIPRNIPISVQITVTGDGSIIRGPYLQLAGFSELSYSPFRFGGNDTRQDIFPDRILKTIVVSSQQFASYASSLGYRGIFGVDYLWDLETESIYSQEINSRLVGSTRLLTGIQKDQQLYPDLLTHVDCFMPSRRVYPHWKFAHGDLDLKGAHYAQLIIRHNKRDPVLVGQRLEPGIYQLLGDTLVRKNDSLFVHEMRQDEILITASAHQGVTLTTDEVLVRLILKRSTIENGNYALNEATKHLVNVIRAFMLRMPV